MQSSNQPWELDTRHLGALVAIARTKSISRAADELGYGQSAVSQQLAALERVVGQRLVDRGTGPRPVTLTAAGETLLAHAQWILERLDCARTDLENLTSAAAGSIRIGTFQSAGSRLLPRVLAAYRKQWPAITVAIHSEGHDGELGPLVRGGALDVAFVEAAFLGPGIDHVLLLRDRFVAVVPPGHRLANRARIRLEELQGEDFVDGSPGEACTNRAQQALRSVGIEPNIVFRTSDNPTRQRLIDAGLGCAVLPELTIEPGLPQGAVVLELKEDLHREIHLAWASDRTPSAALTRFIDTATHTIAGTTAIAPGSR